MCEEPFSEADKQTAVEAREAFFNKNFEECLLNLKKLLANRPNDTKVALNKAIVNYIHKLKFKQSEEFENDLISIAENMGVSLNHSKLNELSLPKPKPIPTEHASLKLNYALLYFYQRQYSQTELILANLMNILSLNHDDFAESAYFYSYLKNLNIIPTKCTKLNHKIIFLYMDTLLALNRHQALFHLCNLLLNFDPGVSVPETLCNVDAFRATFGDIQLHVRIFRLRAALLCGHLQSAEAELESLTLACDDNMLVDSSLPGINPNVLTFLSAQLDYYKYRFGNALKKLAKIGLAGDTSTLEPALMWNNMALVNMRAHKYQLAGIQLRRCAKALDNFTLTTVPAHVQNQRNSKNADNPNTPVVPCQKFNHTLLQNVPIQAFSASPHYPVLYNLALQLLYSNRQHAAFESFVKLAQIFPRNPSIWLRLAECCVRVEK
ncbi:CCR4-NOT transcription complex subunit 10 [Cichlidogyrus casuarinus]|uniref:CCR4-NOT transcription complex subunit 10 n=1 Tax=Cichlidogyrus casuarinus TaxID=1844966 RepID=A0ABD2Q3C4_9PLAT